MGTNANILFQMATSERYLLYIMLALIVLLLWNSRTPTYRNEAPSEELQVVNKHLQEIHNALLNKNDKKHALKEEARAKVVRNDISPDDPELISYVIHHEIHPPSSHGMYKISHNSMVKTYQADVIDKLFGGQRGLYFMECGALDGERSSNTLWLEKDRGWHGVLMEMDPYFFMQLQGKNRKAHSLNVCLSPKPYPIKIDFKESNGGLGSLIQKGKNVGITSYCFPFLTVMLALNVTKVDYFSLDVEGAEIDVLNTIPFDKIDITTFSIEYSHLPGGETALKRLMQSKGYTVHKRIDVNKPQIDFYAQDYIFVKNAFQS